MAGNLQALAALEVDLESRPIRGVTKQDLLDMIQSLAAVKGCMFINGGSSPDHDITCTGSFETIDAWDGSRDTRGVKDGLSEVPPVGWYELKNNADGDWSCAAMVRLQAVDAGTYRLRFAVDDGASINPSPYRDEITLEAGEIGCMQIAGCLLKSLAKGDKLRLELHGNNNKQVTVLYGQFSVNRS